MSGCAVSAAHREKSMASAWDEGDASADPSGFGGGDVNFYGYAGDRPTSLVDPSGLKPGDKYKTLDCAQRYPPNDEKGRTRARWILVSESRWLILVYCTDRRYSNRASCEPVLQHTRACGDFSVGLVSYSPICSSVLGTAGKFIASTS